MNTLLKLILEATTRAENNFLKRDKILNESETVAIKPIIDQLINEVSAGLMTNEEIVSKLKKVEFQLSLKTKLRQEFSIVRESRNVFLEIRTLTLIGLLTALKTQVSIEELDTVDDLICKLDDAVKQKNYTVLKELTFPFYDL